MTEWQTGQKQYAPQPSISEASCWVNESIFSAINKGYRQQRTGNQKSLLELSAQYFGDFCVFVCGGYAVGSTFFTWGGCAVLSRVFTCGDCYVVYIVFTCGGYAAVFIVLPAVVVVPEAGGGRVAGVSLCLMVHCIVCGACNVLWPWDPVNNQCHTGKGWDPPLLDHSVLRFTDILST